VNRALLASVARITGLATAGRETIVLGQRFAAMRVARAHWRTGDYVVGRVRAGSPLRIPFELPSGRMVEVGESDRVIGALGRRAATLEVVGDWQAVGPDEVLEALTPAGLFGRVTSKSDLVPDLVQLQYEGHLAVDGVPARMADFAPPPRDGGLRVPVILIVGSSMSAGKTTTGRAIVRALRRSGRSVVAAKLTGAARYRDVLSLADAGADWIFDFVDAGLPSTVCEPAEYRAAIGGLLGRIGELPADVAVIEAGASPLEPYNGSVAIELLDPLICFMVLCASDPYAVVGIIEAFGRRPDLVCGITANTQAGIELVRRLTGIPALDARSRGAAEPLERLIETALASRAR
jgi:hypothetical protein